jgi:hypothetical protein
MSITPQERDEHFERYADDVADVLRWLVGRWGGIEQIDNSEPDDSDQRRCCLGYAYPDGDQRGHVYADFWYGKTGKVVETRDGKAIHVELADRKSVV